MSPEVTLFVRMGRDLIIPKYQPTKPTLEVDAVVADEDDEEEEQNDEENNDGEVLYSLVFLRKPGNRK